jgi:hypothetical protein
MNKCPDMRLPPWGDSMKTHTPYGTCRRHVDYERKSNPTYLTSLSLFPHIRPLPTPCPSVYRFPCPLLCCSLPPVYRFPCPLLCCSLPPVYRFPCPLLCCSLPLLHVISSYAAPSHIHARLHIFDELSGGPLLI